MKQTPAVVDQAVVEQAEWFGDVTRALIVIHRDRLLHHGVGVEGGVGAVVDSEPPQRFGAGAVAVLVASEHEPR